MLMRLQKYFSECGMLSRRAAEKEILAGNVTVNGKTAQIGDSVDPDTDIVLYKGERLLPRTEIPHLYLMLNKPRGYITSARDERGRRVVTDLVRDVGSRVYPVGRLDMDSEGLLLLTDDGDFTERLTHPRHEIPKIYHVTVRPEPDAVQLLALSQPMVLDGYRIRPVEVKKLSPDVLEMRLYEGRNRQIRKMCKSVELEVTRLRRVAIGELGLGSLPAGKWRMLTPDEVEYLCGKNPEKPEMNEKTND